MVSKNTQSRLRLIVGFQDDHIWAYLALLKFFKRIVLEQAKTFSLDFCPHGQLVTCMHCARLACSGALYGALGPYDQVLINVMVTDCRLHIL